jgi:hypothetical protein
MGAMMSGHMSGMMNGSIMSGGMIAGGGHYLNLRINRWIKMATSTKTS